MTILGAYRLSDDSIVMFADRRMLTSNDMKVISEDKNKVQQYEYNNTLWTICTTWYADTLDKFLATIDKYTNPNFLWKISEFFKENIESSFIVSNGTNIYYCTDHITEYDRTVSSISFFWGILEIYTPSSGAELFELCKKYYAICWDWFDVIHLNKDGTIKNQKRYINTLNIKQV